MSLFQKFRTLAAATIVGIGAALAATSGVQAADENNNQNGYVAKGYDVVAYFSGAPTQGSDEFKAQYDGGHYKFASAENLEKFNADPAAYAPQYGGWCAFATAQGRKFDVDPLAYKVVDGKLYLNNSQGVHKRWLKKEPGYIKGADHNWPIIKSLSQKSLPKSAQGITRGAI